MSRFSSVPNGRVKRTDLLLNELGLVVLKLLQLLQSLEGCRCLVLLLRRVSEWGAREGGGRRGVVLVKLTSSSLAHPRKLAHQRANVHPTQSHVRRGRPSLVLLLLLLLLLR